MIETIPVCAIMRILEREQHMLAEDLAYKRPVPLRDTESILAFCRFIEAIRKSSPVPAPAAPLPAHHRKFYRKTVERLIEAEALPFDAKAEFDNIISQEALKPLQHDV